MPISTIPVEIVVLIVSRGSPVEILKWRQVSQRFKLIVDKSPHIQYILLLSQLGYSEPIKPRRDLTYNDKVDFLKNHLQRLKNCKGIRPDLIEYSGDLRSSSDYGWSRGVFSHLSSQPGDGVHTEDPVSDMFHLYGLPSPNRAISTPSTWQLSDLGVSVMNYASRLSIDLLALFEKNPPPDIGITVHLRSLSSGTTHPSAAVPSLVFRPSQRYSSFDISFRIVGDLVMLMLSMDNEYEKSELVIWDWPSGEKVAHIHTHGYSFAFISPNILLIPQYPSLHLEPARTLGQLDIFTLTPVASKDSDLADAIQLVASLQLPNIGSIHGIVELFVSIDCSSSPTIPSRTAPHNSTSVSETVFDPLPGDEVIIISFLLDCDGSESSGTESVLGTILIHHSDMLEVLRPILSGESPNPSIINWLEWANRATWAGFSDSEPPSLMFFAAGHLISTIHSRQIILYEVRPWSNVVGLFPDESNTIESEESEESEVEPQLSRLPLSVGINRIFTTGSKRPRRPTVLSTFDIPEEVVEPTVAMDEEHVIVIDQTRLKSGDPMYIYALTES